MRATDVIQKKRGTFITQNDGSRVLSSNTELSREEIKFLVDGYVKGEIPDYQVSALLMAIFFNGMTFDETAALTDCMLHSGDVYDLHGQENAGLTGPFVDKHSTGGVGDKISLPLAPIVAACGVQIPMMSGRALGHTGGTLDKLEAITGYRVGLSKDEFKTFIAKTGYAMTGQTKEIVPADRLLYALRDVTGTVESVHLITASILSKKVAEGADALVFDVKCGSGAFMKSPADAELLANSLVKTAHSMGKKASALITGMDSPLGRKIGNFLEIEETIDCLKGAGPADVMELTYALGAEMLVLGGKAQDKDEGAALCKEAVSSGRALEKFFTNVEDQGGSVKKLLEDAGKRRSPHKMELTAAESGYISIEAYKMGIAGVALGVGRTKTTDSVCAEAGMVLHAVQGDFVHKGDLIMEIYGKDAACLDEAKKQLEAAVTYSEKAVDVKPLILKEIRQ